MEKSLKHCGQWMVAAARDVGAVSPDLPRRRAADVLLALHHLVPSWTAALHAHLFCAARVRVDCKCREEGL